MREIRAPNHQIILKSRLRQLLKDRAWTAAELSRRSGVPKQVLSLWLSGVEPRKLQHVKSVAHVFGVTVDQLCFVPHEDYQHDGWIEGVFEGRIRIARFK